MKTLFFALIAFSLSITSNAACAGQNEALPADTKLKGTVTEVTSELREPTVTGGAENTENTSILSVLDQTSHPALVKTGLLKKAAGKVVSLGNFVFDLRGFDWSVEGADVALEEKLTYKSEMAREYAVRRLRDQRELKAVCEIFQASMASGIDNADRKDKMINASTPKLVDLFGEAGTRQLLDHLNNLSAAKSASVLRQSPAANWTVDEQQEKLKLIVEATIEKDPQVKEILVRLHKFNGRSKFARVTAKLVYTTLGLASFAPTFVAPAAELSLLTFMTATGGPEQDKLLREMYLYKCLESRYKTIHEEAHLAVTNAQIAALTGNKPLATCSMEMINRIAGPTATALVFPLESRQVAAETIPQS